MWKHFCGLLAIYIYIQVEQQVSRNTIFSVTVCTSCDLPGNDLSSSKMASVSSRKVLWDYPPSSSGGSCWGWLIETSKFLRSFSGLDTASVLELSVNRMQNHGCTLIPPRFDTVLYRNFPTFRVCNLWN